MFDNVLSALPEDVIAAIMDVLEDAGEDTPYTTIKNRLMETHVLSDSEKMELLFKLPSLGARKPSQLLTNMLDVCPAGEEKTKLFMFMFLQRLPKDLRLMMGEVEHGDPRTVAARADRLWAGHARQHAEAVIATASEVTEDTENSTVAAIQRQAQQQRRGQWRKNKQKRPERQQRVPREKTAPMDLAITASGLCRAHWFHGENARACTQGMTCSWEEN